MYMQPLNLDWMDATNEHSSIFVAAFIWRRLFLKIKDFDVKLEELYSGNYYVYQEIKSA